MSETVGIRELRHHAAVIVSAAEAGQQFHVTVRGKDTGVVIAKHPAPAPPAAPERRRGITLDDIKRAGLYTRATSAGYREALLEIVERGRTDAGRVGDLGR